ncbi:M48 family metallopeptidase [Myxococcota bacterium]|nr:M48 family metallopeptidase [Myxococcota bacterium]
MTPGARVDQANKRELLARLERDALHLCARFGLRYRVLEAERANVKRRYGVCYSDGTIRIRLRHATTGRALKYSSLVNTLCHELAHLQHFNHGPRFQALYARILECARRDGIYRPKQSLEWDPRGALPGNGPRALRPTAPRPASRPSPSPHTAAAPARIDPRGIPVRRPRTAFIQLDLFDPLGRPR